MKSDKEYTPKNILTLIAIGWVLVFGTAMITGCEEPNPQEKLKRVAENYGGAPSDATNIEIIDKNWFTFEWRGQCFLAMNGMRRTAITEIDCKG